MTDTGLDAQNWRLKASLAPNARPLDALIRHLRKRTPADQLASELSHDMVITHDGRALFVYSSAKQALEQVKSNLEVFLRADNLSAVIFISCWDNQLDDWKQVLPPPSGEEKRAQTTAKRSATSIETRTLVANVGKAIRPSFEQSLVSWADELGIRCDLVEHPHLLTTQVAFTVTGPKRKVDEFTQGLAAEERATLRVDGGLLRLI